MNRSAWLLLILILPSAGCQKSGSHPPAPPAQDSPSASAKIEAKGLHNVYRITDQLLSGSSPEGEDGFRSLQKLGVKTLISVDGAQPDVTRARNYGLRYVHLPVGYDAIPQEHALRLAKALRDLPGPFYVHCHHGKHRGPAAAAILHLCQDEKCGVDTVLEEMRRAGTDPHYAGLYAAPKALRRPTPKDLERVPAQFPEVAQVTGLAHVMVAIDGRWENLKIVRAAGWKVPADHPDVDPPHEALQLVEHYREAARLKQVNERAPEFRRWLSDAETQANDLERILRLRTGKLIVNEAAAEKAFRQAGEACTRCHAKYRDVPR